MTIDEMNSGETLELPEQERRMSDRPATAPAMPGPGENPASGSRNEMGGASSSDYAGGLGGTYGGQADGETGAVGSGMPQSSAQPATPKEERGE